MYPVNHRHNGTVNVVNPMKNNTIRERERERRKEGKAKEGTKGEGLMEERERYEEQENCFK